MTAHFPPNQASRNHRGKLFHKRRVNMQNKRGIAMVCKKVSMKKQPTDFAYWQTRSYEARLAALEEIRREYHGWDDESEQRLERVYRIIKL